MKKILSFLLLLIFLSFPIYADELGLRVDKIYTGSVYWNPASVAANSNASTTLEIVGLEPPATTTAFNVWVFPPYTLEGLTASGYVSSANTVTIMVHSTGAIVDLSGGTWKIWVIRAR